MKSVVRYLHCNYSSHLGIKDHKNIAALGMHRSPSHIHSSSIIERVCIISGKYKRKTLVHGEDIRCVKDNIISMSIREL
jgi:hypothetical protein